MLALLAVAASGTFTPDPSSVAVLSQGICLPGSETFCCKDASGAFGVCGYSQNIAGTVGFFAPGAFGSVTYDVYHSTSVTKCTASDTGCFAKCAATKAWGLEASGNQVIGLGAPANEGYLLKDRCPYGNAIGGSSNGGKCEAWCNHYTCANPNCMDCTICSSHDVTNGRCAAWCHVDLCSDFPKSEFLKQHCGNCAMC